VVGGLISSGAGHDLLVADPIWYAGSPVADDTIRRNNRPSVVCHDSLFQVYGNRGNDQLVGSAWPDRLIGGPRNDRVNGNRGRDHCQAERAQNCEVMVARRRPSRVA
jgi:Ca2+-binding RTX toxin-like protein